MNKLSIVLSLFLGAFFCGCAVNGTIVDRSTTSIRISKLKLTESPHLRIYHGGAIRDVPLKSVRSVTIHPQRALTYNGEFFYGAQIELQKEGKIRADKNHHNGDTCFISLQNTLVGRGKDGSYKISMDNVSRIMIE